MEVFFCAAITYVILLSTENLLRNSLAISRG